MIISRQAWHCLLIAAAVCLLVVQPLMAADGIDGNLVSVHWLEKNLNRDDVVLLDASVGQIFAAKHIAGAVNVDVFTFGGREIPRAEMERRIRSWGISAGTKVVIYDQGGTYFATSLVFDLYYHGIPAEDLFVLDGGLTKWQAAGGTVTKEPSAARKPGTFRVAKLREEVRVRLPEFLTASGDPTNNTLVEALDANNHFGGFKFFDRAGHVPNAIMAPSADFFNADKTFKSAKEIRRMLAYLGIKPEQQIHAHCGGGIAASVPFFAMKFMLDYPKVKLYKGSQLEWLRDDRSLPYWTYDAPNLLREKGWLASWGNATLRGFGVTKMSIVDVRPPESYQHGHVPYAVNIPADVFKRHLTTPGKLTEVLGAAGIDADHEAVIVSEGGVNPNSALAFVALEKLGQKSVAVLTNTVDDWAFGGLPLVTEATTVGPRKSPQDLAIPLTVYAASARAGILTTGSGNTHGAYPKVYLASGKAVPVKRLEGDVIHLPYTELLNSGGTPKAAKDIWSILVKAGLPRYAEIICYADDPGEAAANYFILKLMGYPDVKMLVI
ncbi:MAG: rhodanese-like domain-containing protein [Sterolibacterium sp.]